MDDMVPDIIIYVLIKKENSSGGASCLYEFEFIAPDASRHVVKLTQCLKLKEREEKIFEEAAEAIKSIVTETLGFGNIVTKTFANEQITFNQKMKVLNLLGQIKDEIEVRFYEPEVFN